MSGGLEYGTVVVPLLEWLNSLPECKAINIHGNAYNERGTPDIIGCIKGRMFTFECKKIDGRVAKIQQFRIAQWNAAGALTAVVWSVEEAKQYMKDAGLI